VDVVTLNQHTVECEVLKVNDQTVKRNSGHSDPETKDGTLLGTEYVGQTLKTAEDTVIQSQQMV
jgi:hypothetical protein